MHILISTVIKTSGILVRIGRRTLRFENSFHLPTRDNLHKRISNYIHCRFDFVFIIFIFSSNTECPCEQFRNCTFWNLLVAHRGHFTLRFSITEWEKVFPFSNGVGLICWICWEIEGKVGKFREKNLGKPPCRVTPVRGHLNRNTWRRARKV